MRDEARLQKPSPRDKTRVVWLLSIVFSAIVALAVESILWKYPASAKLLSKVIGPVAKDLFPAFIFLVLELNWWIIWEKIGRASEAAVGFVKFMIFLVFFSTSMGILVAACTWAIGGTWEAVIVAGLIGEALWIVVNVALAWFFFGRRYCPECGARVSYTSQETFGGPLPLVVCSDECGWSDIDTRGN